MSDYSSPVSRASRATRRAIADAVAAADRTAGSELRPATHAWLADKNSRAAAAAAAEIDPSSDSISALFAAAIFPREARTAAAIASAAVRVSRIRELLDSLESV